MSSPGPLQICLLFTPELCRTDPWQTLARALAAGLDLVQWRRKARDPQGLTLCLARCAEHGVPVIVNDFVDLACATAAAGAHVGQEDMPASEASPLNPLEVTAAPPAGQATPVVTPQPTATPSPTLPAGTATPQPTTYP